MAFTLHTIAVKTKKVPHWIGRFVILLNYSLIFMKTQLSLTFSIFQHFKIISSSVAFNNGDTGGLYLSYVSGEYEILSNQYYLSPYFISSGNMISSSISLSCQQCKPNLFSVIVFELTCACLVSLHFKCVVQHDHRKHIEICQNFIFSN